MINLPRAFFVAALLLVPLTFAANVEAGEACPQIPSVSWWGDTSPEGLTAYVDRKHDGDWDPYLKKWTRYEERMRDILSNGRSAVVKSQKLVLKGEKLARHIEKIAKRVEATRCIAAQVIETRLAEGLNSMSTAAGGVAEPEMTAGACPKFNKVVWWETSHAKVASYVASRHGGDWKDYVAKWDKQLEKMKSLSENGGAAVFKSKKLRLEGKLLLQYIEAIKDRLSVTKCLAKREMANSGYKKRTPANDG